MYIIDSTKRQANQLLYDEDSLSTTSDSTAVLMLSSSVHKEEEYMFTFRAVFIGCCLGAIISASNMVIALFNYFVIRFL